MGPGGIGGIPRIVDPAPGPAHPGAMDDRPPAFPRAPRPFEPERAAPALAALGDLGGARALVEGAAASSPHLARLLAREGAWIVPSLRDPLGALESALGDAADGADAGPALRRAKRRVGLLVALMDLGGAWALEEVTGALTRLADLAVDRAFAWALRQGAGRGRLGGLDPEGAGLVAMAMGKMGAGELNYSSDIDLIVLHDEARLPADAEAARAGLVRATRAAVALLSDRTAEGYVFRVDLRLRPDAATTPVCMSLGAAESYYEGVGRTWERAAWIKARPCGGDLAAGERFLGTLRPFVWRRHLDFAAIQDAHDMRLRIRDHRGSRAGLDGRDLKLGRGGIREIEFFVQTRQLIAGGRDPSLRVRGTVEGLGRLAAAGWVPEGVAATLAAHYRRFREVEHRLQMVADAQTHDLPSHPEGWGRLAALMDEEAAALRRDLAERLEEVHALTEGFFAPGVAAPGPQDGFGAETVARWPSYPALRSPRAAEIMRRLRPTILGRLKEAQRPEEALAAFDRFLAGLPAGVQLLSLFEANPDLLGLLVDVAATSPALGRALSRNAGVLDAVLGGDFFAPWPGVEGLAQGLAAAMAEGSWEGRLDAARLWAREWRFRLGVHHLRGLLSAEEAGAQAADLAEATLRVLLPATAAEFARRHGPAPGRGAAVLAMGSLGARRLTATSDLDLIVIHDGGEAPSEGPRPLAPGSWYARLAQALVTALSAPMSKGRLYEVDMRLRPSGRQGPVATSLASFGAYQREEAWTWEHLALTRARVVASVGDPALGPEVEALRRDVIASRRGDPRVWPDLADMRRRLSGQGGPWDAKAGPGRLRDLDLFAQALALLAGSPGRGTDAQVAAGEEAGLLDAAEAATIREASRLFWAVQAAARLLLEGPLDPGALGEGGRRLLLREGGADTIPALADRLAAVAAGAAAAIGRRAS